MIYIACDHGGYKMKKLICEELARLQIQYDDIGSHSGEIVRYPYYAARVASAVSSGKIKRGILICSTGIGMSIIANKYKGVRASLCTNEYMGKMTRAHNDSNILCLGGKITGDNITLDILRAWLTTEYEGGRHDISLDMIKSAEEEMLGEKCWIPTDPII